MIIDRKHSRSRSIPLQWLISLAFVVQIFGAVGLVAYLSYRSGQESANKLALRLKTEISTRVTEKTTTYLQAIDQVNKNNISDLRRGMWSFNNFSSQERQAWQQMQLSSLSPITIIGFGTPTGGHRALETLKDGTFSIRAAPNSGGKYRTFTTNPDGSPSQVTETSVDFDSRKRPWFKVAVQSSKAAWTNIYPHMYTGELLVALAEPVYDLKNGDFLGVTYGTRSLEEISSFLRTIDIQAGTVFIMESDQTLVAISSLAQKPNQLLQNAKEQKLLKAIDSPNLQISGAAKYLRDRNVNLANIRQAEQFELEINGDRQLVQATPLRDRNGLDWIIVVVIPESDFMADIQANRVWTILLCGMTLLVTTGLSIITTRWISKPILRLSQASKAIATGEWQEPLNEDGHITELNSLSASFNQMAGKFQQSLDQKSTALQEKEYWFNRLVEIIPDPIFLKDGEGQYLIINRQGLKLFDLSDTNYFGKTDTELAELNPFHHDSLLYCAAIDETTWTKKEVSRTEEQIPQVDGSQIIFDVVRVPLFTESGDRKGLVVIARDISDRKQAEIDLQISKNKLNDILNSATASITRLLVKADGNFKIDYISDGCEVVSGYTATELIADQSLWVSRANPEDWKAVEAQLYENIFAERTGIYIYRLQHKDGSWRWISQTNNSHWDAPQNAWVVTIISSDISDRKQVEIALKQSELRNQAMLSAIPDLLLRVRQDGSCLDFIPPLTDQAGTFLPVTKHLSEVLPPDLLELQLQRIAQALATGELQVWEHQIIKNDQISHEEIRVFPCGIDECLVIVRDVSARKQTELDLIEAKIAAEAATKAKSEFLASMSHEIRTPMNGVIGMTQILGMTELTTDQQGFVKTIKDSSDALLTIINDILDFSKIESGMLEIESRAFDLEEVIRGVCNLLESQAIAKQIDLKYAIAPNIPKIVIGDLARLRQILLNLVGNAVKFTQNGHVSISVSGKKVNEKYELTFAIADTGIGIASDRLDILFQAFTQADNSISREYGGTGLGLAISNRLANLMEGTIWVESLGQVGGSPPIAWKPQPLNPLAPQGSTFYFTITLSINQMTNQPPTVLTQEFAIDEKFAEKFPLRILLVEDNPVNQMVAKLMLQRLGYQIDAIANNGLEAVQSVQNGEYDLILMDVQMPKMDGLTATKIIRTELKNNVRIVAMTADAMPEDRQACLDTGMDDFISKPISIEALMSVVSSAK
jgi:PAS domain S-box-containing protein